LRRRLPPPPTQPNPQRQVAAPGGGPASCWTAGDSGAANGTLSQGPLSHAQFLICRESMIIHPWSTKFSRQGMPGHGTLPGFAASTSLLAALLSGATMYGNSNSPRHSGLGPGVHAFEVGAARFPPSRLRRPSPADGDKGGHGNPSCQVPHRF
jgi:hypothetical protein